MERGGKIWYYHYDEHGSTRLLTNETGEITDCYAYDACGNLLKKGGDMENDFLYTGEQYNANPVTYTDSTGYFSSAEFSIAGGIQSALNFMHQLNSLRNIIKWAAVRAVEVRRILI